MQYIFKLRFKNATTKHFFTINTSVYSTDDQGRQPAIITAWHKALDRGIGLASVEDNIYLYDIKLLFVRR